MEPVVLVLVDMRKGLKYVCDDGGDGSLDEIDILNFITGVVKKDIVQHKRSEPRPLMDRNPRHKAALRCVASSIDDMLIFNLSLLVIHCGPPPTWALELASALQTTRGVGKTITGEEALPFNVVLIDAVRNELPEKFLSCEGIANSNHYCVRWVGQQTKVGIWSGVDLEQVGLASFFSWLLTIIKTENFPVFQDKIFDKLSWLKEVEVAYDDIHAKEAQIAREASDEAYLEMFNRLDADGGGFVDMEELVSAIKNAAMAPPGEERALAKEHMEKIDANNDGQISKIEWLQFFRDMEAENGTPDHETVEGLRHAFGCPPAYSVVDSFIL